MTILALALIALLSPQAAPEKSEVERLKADLDRKEKRILDLQRQLDSSNQRLYDLEQARTPLQPPAEKLAKDLAELEKKHLELAREKAFFADHPRAGGESWTGLRYLSFPVLTGKVTAVANEIGLVVVSVGADDGVLPGDEFTVTREKIVIAKIRIDRVDRKWAAGKVVEQRGPPLVADDVARTTSKTVPAPGTPMNRAAADEVQSLRKELDDVRNQVRQLTDRLVPSFQGPGVSVEESPAALSDHLGIQRGLLVGGSARARRRRRQG
jgi:hypothetical protein